MLAGSVGDIAVGIVLVIVVLMALVVMGGLPFYAIYKAWPGIKAQNERLRNSDRHYNPYTHQWTF
ncbi:MAG: hypothetical protein QOJ29_3563, partial [Thermoleophilaceae bacterium]|nr:hypothetical protein [Thermoleophilaceae bacterium]